MKGLEQTKSVVFPAAPMFIGSEPQLSAFQRSRRRWVAALLIGLVTAAGTGILGLTMGALAAYDLLPGHPALGYIGTLMLIVSFCAAVFGAHCLDKAREAQKLEREEYCRRHSMPDRTAQTFL